MIGRFTTRAATVVAVLALTLFTFIGVSAEVSAQTATPTATATATETAAPEGTGTAPAPATTGNAGLMDEGTGVVLPAALAVAAVVMVASGWYVAGRRRA